MPTLLLLIAMTATLATPTTPAPTSRDPTPLEELEAWDPIGDTRDPVAHPLDVAPPSDSESQALRALVPVIGGTGVGIGAAVVAAYLSASTMASFPPGLIGGLVLAAALFVGVPAASVALFLKDLPGWTPWPTSSRASSTVPRARWM